MKTPEKTSKELILPNYLKPANQGQDKGKQEIIADRASHVMFNSDNRPMIKQGDEWVVL